MPSLQFSLHLPPIPFPPSPAETPHRRAGGAAGWCLGEAFLAGHGLQPARGAAGTRQGPEHPQSQSR